MIVKAYVMGALISGYNDEIFPTETNTNMEQIKNIYLSVPNHLAATLPLLTEVEMGHGLFSLQNINW